jgi:hypothetical protein
MSKKKASPKKKVAKKKVAPKVTVELMNEGKGLRGTGATILAAFKNIKYKEKPKSRTNIRITFDKKVSEIPVSLSPNKLERS